MMAHFLIKAVFCGVYVGYLNEADWIRITVLTFLNTVLLVLNFVMKPCSIKVRAHEIWQQRFVFHND